MAGGHCNTDSEHQPFSAKCEILVIIHLGHQICIHQPHLYKDSIQEAIWSEPASVQQANSGLTHTQFSVLVSHSQRPKLISFSFSYILTQYLSFTDAEASKIHQAEKGGSSLPHPF